MLKNAIESKAWNITITSIILFNAVILGLDTSPFIKEKLGSSLSWLDNICLVIFTIELLLRLFCYRLRFFSNDEKWWNIFDFVIIVLSIFAVEYSIFRALRILRVLRLVSSVPSIRLVTDAVLRTIPAMLSIASLLCVFFYVYAVLCVRFFGEQFPQWFGDIPKALYSLFQIMTLESWSMGIVRPVMEVFPYAWILFISFIVIVGMVTLNLVVGVIVNSLNEISQNNQKDEKQKE